MHGRIKLTDKPSADVEAEDVDLGVKPDDLAFDVDENVGDEDPDALDSDDEHSGIDEELGIVMDETEGMLLPTSLSFFC